jgi:hypothetical protein
MIRRRQINQIQVVNQRNQTNLIIKKMYQLDKYHKRIQLEVMQVQVH